MILISLRKDGLIKLNNNSLFFSGFRHQIMLGSLMRIEYAKLRSMSHVPLFKCNVCS